MPYIQLTSMFETKEDREYSTYLNINQDIFTWKQQDIGNVSTNSHGLLEMVFNLSDATLMGSSDHIEKMTEVVSRYQIRLNNQILKENAYINCTVMEECSSLINLAPSKIANAIVSHMIDADED